MNNATATWDFFDRPEGRNFDPENVRMLSLVLPADLTLEEALAAARSGRHGGRLGAGTFRSGCFQVQGPAGIWQTTDERKIRLDTPGQRAKVMFATWDELEALEAAGDARWFPAAA